MHNHKYITGLLFMVFLALGPGLTIFSANVEEIGVGTMDMPRNLNPYLAESEIELALQTIVFPPLVADFMIGQREEGDSFRGVLVSSNNIFRKRTGDSLEFSFRGSLVTPGIYIENFNRIKSLGPHSNFSWNLRSVENVGEDKVQVHFDSTHPLGKLIASSFPLVDFNALDGNWNRSDQEFMTNADRSLLIGFSDYGYEHIEKGRTIICLSPRATRQGKKVVVKTMPDYKQLIDQLNAGELQVAFNISPLSHIHNPEIENDDMQFANQYMLYMTVTSKGRQKGLANMDIIYFIRNRFKNGFIGDDVLMRSGNLFLRQGFLVDNADLQVSSLVPKLKNNETVTLLYYRSDLNDRVKAILEGIFSELRVSFKAVAVDRTTSRSHIYENDFDLVLKADYIQFPEFLNIRYYKKFLAETSVVQSASFSRRVDRLLGQGGKITQLQAQARELEQDMLKHTPIVFFLRYNTRIAVKKGIRHYRSETGVPFFFYKLSQW